MNIETQNCEPEMLESFLCGELNKNQERVLTEHLDSCTSCRQTLESSAAEPDGWREAGSLLKPTVFDWSLENSQSEAEDQDGVAQPSLQIRNVLESLTPSENPNMLGQLGGYEVSGVVGAGAMGVVLKAADKSLDRTVAIKVLSPHLASSGAARKRFAREAKAAAAVLHPNVIAIHGVFNDQSLPHLVMPYIRGTSLQKRLNDEGSLPVNEILRIGAQIAAGLAAAHVQGLVHRDIKPANILLEEGVERVALTDFGLARAVDDASLTRTGVIAGTPQYMSPEQSRGEPVDQRSDLFSLGSVVYAMCAGRPPFRSESTYGVIQRINNDQPTPIREINPDVPEWLAQIIEKLMSKQAVDRYESAQDVSDLLEQCLAHVQQPSATPLPDSLVARTRSSRFLFGSRRKTGIAAVMITLGLILLGMFLWQGTDPPDISGNWCGDDWGEVELKHQALGQYKGEYTDTFGDQPGTMELKWSRLERRFNGTWQQGEARLGKVSLRHADDRIFGAWTTNENSGINAGRPELADLRWTRRPANLVENNAQIPRTNNLHDLQNSNAIGRLKELGIAEHNSSAKSDFVQADSVPAIFGSWAVTNAIKRQEVAAETLGALLTVGREHWSIRSKHGGEEELYRYEIQPGGKIVTQLVKLDSPAGPVLGRYLLVGDELSIACNDDPDKTTHPPDATGDIPQEGVTYLSLKRLQPPRLPAPIENEKSQPSTPFSVTDPDTAKDIAAANEVANKFVTATLRGRTTEMESLLSPSHDPSIGGEFIEDVMQIVFGLDPEFTEAFINHQDPDDMLLTTPTLPDDKRIQGPVRLTFGMKRERDGWRVCEVLFPTPKELDNLIAFYETGEPLQGVYRMERDLKMPGVPEELRLAKASLHTATKKLQIAEEPKEDGLEPLRLKVEAARKEFQRVQNEVRKREAQAIAPTYEAFELSKPPSKDIVANAKKSINKLVTKMLGEQKTEAEVQEKLREMLAHTQEKQGELRVQPEGTLGSLRSKLATLEKVFRDEIRKRESEQATPKMDVEDPPEIPQDAVLYFYNKRTSDSWSQVMDELIKEGHPIVQIDIDQHPDLAKRFKVARTPMLTVLRGGNEEAHSFGGNPEMARKFVEMEMAVTRKRRLDFEPNTQDGHPTD